MRQLQIASNTDEYGRIKRQSQGPNAPAGSKNTLLVFYARIRVSGLEASVLLDALSRPGQPQTRTSDPALCRPVRPGGYHSWRAWPQR
jgi:hypothetical protein